MPFEVSTSRRPRLQAKGRKRARGQRPPGLGAPGQPTPLDGGDPGEAEAEISGPGQAALESLVAFLMVFLAGLGSAAVFPL